MLACSQIKKSYGSVTALAGADLELSPGEVRALVGGNGSGKSTLAKILGGTVYHDSGEILMDGERVDLRSPLASIQAGIGITHQELSLLPNLTVAENLSVSSIPRKWFVKTDYALINSRAREMLAQVGLEQFAATRAQRLSIQDQYLVELLKALAHKPRFLVLDEVTSAMHFKQVEHVFTIIKKLSAEGCAVVLVTHRLHEVYAICNHISIMRNGAVVEAKPIDQIDADEVVSIMSGGSFRGGPASRPTRAEASPQTPQPPAAADVDERKPLLSVKDLPAPSWNVVNSFNLFPGEILGLGGLHGQGQSELLRILFGALPGQTARMILEGGEIQVSRPMDAVRHGLVFFSGDRESEGIFPHRSVEENMTAVPGSFSGNSNGRTLGLSVRSVVEKLGIVLHSVQQRITSLSGGNQQKVIIGRWLGVGSKVLLADDPTKGVDVQARKEVHQVLKELSLNGVGIIVASSDDHELVDLADRIVVMNEGRMVRELTGDQRTVQQIISASLPGMKKGMVEE